MRNPLETCMENRSVTVDSLFAENDSLILMNLSLTVLNNVFMLLCSKNKLVSSANIIVTSTFEELGRSFTCHINNNSPSIEPCGIPHLISFFTVSADSVIFIYCFLHFKYLSKQARFGVSTPYISSFFSNITRSKVSSALDKSMNTSSV